MTQPPPSREVFGAEYLDQLPYPPYPVQEEAALAWFMAEKGIMVCAHGHGQNANSHGGGLEAVEPVPLSITRRL